MTPQTLGELLRQRASDMGAKTVYGVLDDSASIRQEISFEELRAAASRVAARLTGRFDPGSRIVLAYPSGIEFIVAFFGCVLSGMIAVPVAAPKRNRANERFKAIVGDARPAGLLTVRDWTDLLEKELGAAGSAAAVCATDAGELTGCTPRERLEDAAPADVAYLQYTSGSITTPKGVAITHANVLSNSSIIRDVEENDAQTVSLTWLPNFHDMGLVEGLIQALYSGVLGLIMAPAAFLHRPRLWLEAISRHRVTNSGAPNFAYQMLVDREGGADGPPLDLSSWRVAYNGAEPIRDGTLRRFLEVFAPYGFSERAFYPVYGLAEATLVVTSGRQKDLPVRLVVDRDRLERGRAVPAAADGRRTSTLVASGRILRGECEHGTEVVIVDPASGEPLPDGTIGEVLLAGPSVAAGYWNRPEETRETFAASVRGRPGEAFARTGDLAFAREGSLFLTGRVHDLIISKGRNLYPHDIEWLAATASESVRPWSCAAFSLRADPEDRIILVCEAKRNAAPQELEAIAAAVRERISTEAEIELDDVVFIRPGTLPRTTSGKVQRQLCREMLAGGHLAVELSTRQLEAPQPAQAAAPDTRALRDELRSLVDRGRGAAPIPDEGLVCEHVNDSLQAVKLCHELERRYGVAVPASWILGRVTLSALAARISSRLVETRQRAESAPPAAAGTHGAPGPIPLSYGQQALWSLAAVAPESVAYHLCRVLDIAGPLDVAVLRRALDLLAVRHASLRTRFEAVDGVPRQAFDSSKTVAWEYDDLTALDERHVRRLLDDRAWRPFDLEQGGLLRFHVLRRGSDRHLVLIAIHHIVADLWSVAQLVDELFGEYDALASGRWAQPPPAGHYGDFVAWQRRLSASAEGRAMREMWKARVSGLPAETALPLDRLRAPFQTFRGETIEHDLDEALTERIDRSARAAGTTPFCVMLAAFLVLLHRLAGQRCVAAGVPVSGRTREAFASTIGFLANVNVVASELSASTSWRDVLARTHAQVLAALDAQDYPLALVVEDAGAGRDARRSPLVQQMFSLESPPRWEALAPFVAGRSGGLVERSHLTLTSFALPQRGAQFDLHARFVRHGERLLGNWTFNSDLFDEATVRRWSAAYVSLLDAALQDPECAVAALPVDGGRDASISRGVAGDRVELDDRLALHDLVARQARETPDRVAVSFGDAGLTCAQLLRRATAVARALRQRGVGLDDLVAVCLERSIELPVVLLGILEAGAGYLPIATDWPVARIEEVLAEARSPILIVDEVRGTAGARQVTVGMLLEEPVERAGRERRARPAGDNAAYAIFTSGSTGRPKAAVNTHRGLVNRLRWMQHAYGLAEDDHVLQKTPYTFDVSVWELFWPLIAGARLVVAPPAVHRDPLALAQVTAEREVTVLHFVPSMLAIFCEHAGPASIHSVRLLVCSGEVLPKAVQTAALEMFRGSVHNLYGPTEAAIDVTAWRSVPRDPSATVPIGRPIANMTIRILDGALGPVIPGATGELCIAGPGLARGYVGRPELTAASFVPDPYGDGGRLYRTGDRARLRSDLAIEFQGRTDDQVKVRGFRVELPEIETHLNAHPAVSSAAVVARNEGQFGTRLTAYYVVREGEPVPPLRRWLGDRVPDYLIPACFVQVPAMPLLESGKVDRAALATLAGHPAAGPAIVAPRTELESRLAEVWQEVLGVSSVGVTQTFFDLGGDSLLVVRAAARARQRGLNVTAECIYQRQTIERVCERLGSEAGPGPEAAYRPFSLLDPSDRRRLPPALDDAMPLARLQEAMVYQIESSANYIAYVASVHLRARFRADLWEQVVDAALARHAYLRVSFAREGFREPLQLVHRRVERPLRIEDVRHLQPEAQEEHLARWLSAEKKHRFAWDVPPLVRLTLHRRTGDTFQLTLTEATLDGWSIAVLLASLCREYRARLRGQRLKPARAEAPSYARFVELERQAARDPAHEDFWRRMLAPGHAARLPRWPAGWRSSDHTLHARHTVSLAADLVDRLKARARAAGAPLKSVFLAAHFAVLRTLTGCDDVLTELITHGRPDDPGGDVAIGLYTNTIPVQASIGPMRWIDLIHEAHRLETETYPHRRFPFADIHRMSRHPLLHEAAFNFTHFHVYHDLLDGDPELEVLDVQAFDQTYFALTAYFNLLKDDRLSLDLDYDPTQLAREQVVHAGGYYERALRAMAVSPDASVRDTSLLSATERARELEEWSIEPCPAGEPQDPVDLVHAHCRERPDRIAIVHGGAAMTYGALRRRAAALRDRLAALGVGPEAAVGVLLERSPDFVVAVLAILECGGAFVPLDARDPEERRAAVIRDAGLRAIVVDRADRGTTAAAPLVSCLDLHRTQRACVSVRRRVPPDALAYCIFTSGSTGAPKGVEVSRRALASFVQAATPAYRLEAADRVLQCAALGFDAALEEIFGALCAGATLVLRSEDALDSFDAFLAMCARDAVTVLDLPTAFWHQLTGALRQRGALGRSVRALILGGEKAIAQTLADWWKAVGPRVTVHNTYGPTEATIVSLLHTCDPRAAVEDDVPIGRPLAGVTAYVLQPGGEVGPVGCPGELALGGRSLARGYRGRGDLTADRFRPNPFGPEGSRLYWTGDLVRRRPDGAVDFVGRRDEQVKIRGFRVELSEIESALEADARVGQAAVVARVPAGDVPPALAAYVVPRRWDGQDAHTLAEDLRDALRGRLPEYMVPAAIEVARALPLTRFGKVDKAGLPAPRPAAESRDGRAGLAARGPVEETIAAIYRQCLGLDSVPSAARFLDLGGDSLSAMRIVSRIQDQLHVSLKVRDIFEARGVTTLAARIGGMRRDRAGIVPGDVPALRRDPSAPPAMSFAQERLWFLHQFDRTSTSYNVPAAFWIRGRLNRLALHQAWAEICRRHHVLRMQFVDRGASPEAVLRSEFVLPLRLIDLRSIAPRARRPAAAAIAQGEARRHFDLTHDPLIRVACIQTGADEILLVVVMHHIVTDEWCAEIFMDELRRFYEGALAGVPPRLADPPAQYSDFARWQKAAVSGPRLQALQEFWVRELSGAPAVVELPVDVPREAAGRSQAGRRYFDIEPRVARGLRSIADTSAASLFMVLLSVYQVLLRSVSGMDDVVVGSPVTGRTAPETEKIVGLFANLIVLRSRMRDDMPFVRHLARVRETALACYDHQALSFAQLVAVLNPERSALYAPVVQVIFGLWPQPAGDAQFAGLQLEPLPLHSGQAKYDLEMQVADRGDALHGFLEYNAALFEPPRIAALVSTYQRLCEAVVDGPETTLSELQRRTTALHLARTS